MLKELNIVEKKNNATGLSEAIKEKDHQRKQKCLEHILTHLKALTLSLEQLTIFSDQSTTLVNCLVSKILGKMQGTEMLVDLANLGTR